MASHLTSTVMTLVLLFIFIAEFGYVIYVKGNVIPAENRMEEDNNAVKAVQHRTRRGAYHWFEDWVRRHSHLFGSASDLPAQDLPPFPHGSTDFDTDSGMTYCTIYSDVNGDVSMGTSRDLHYDVEDLDALGWKHVTSAIRCYGMWLLYKEPDYNADGQGGVGYVFKNTPEFVPFTGSLWSRWDNQLAGLRSVGPERDPFTTSSITVYEHEWFSGRQYMTLTDVPRLPVHIDDKAFSVMITGFDDWTIFQEAEFEGASECLLHEPDGSAAFKALYLLAGKITSIKKGCTP